jgi:hypothetical protein
MSFDNEYTPCLSVQHIELIHRIYLGMSHARSVAHLLKLLLPALLLVEGGGDAPLDSRLVAGGSQVRLVYKQRLRPDQCLCVFWFGSNRSCFLAAQLHRLLIFNCCSHGFC